MINQRGINKIPEFILPQTSIKSYRTIDYGLEDTRTVKDIWLEIPTFYKKLAVSITAMFLGTAVGVIAPYLTRLLEGLF